MQKWLLTTLQLPGKTDSKKQEWHLEWLDAQMYDFKGFNNITEIFQNKTVKLGLEAGC
jgi:hypothetical protein